MYQFIFRHRLVSSIAAVVIVVAAFGMRVTLNNIEDGPPKAEIVVSALKEKYPDQAAEAVLAKKYWAENPGVRTDKFFGDGGTLGVYGAREHYLRHGKTEGRNWPG